MNGLSSLQNSEDIEEGVLDNYVRFLKVIMSERGKGIRKSSYVPRPRVKKTAEEKRETRRKYKSSEKYKAYDRKLKKKMLARLKKHPEEYQKFRERCNQSNVKYYQKIHEKKSN